MPDEKKTKIPKPPKKATKPDDGTRRVVIQFRGRGYPALAKDGELIGIFDKLPRGSGSAEWRAAVKMAVME